MASAVLTDGKYLASAPVQVGELPKLLQDIQSEHGTTLIGFDFPIGLPMAYAAKINTPNFLAFLETLEPGAPFFQVCTHQNQISLSRPFYPNAPGETARHHLSDAFGIEFSNLLRACERRHANRPEAGVLFWTLGAKQPGKAAIVGWGEVLAPALRNDAIKLWPFHGHLDSLLQSSPIVAAETYPAQYYAAIFNALAGRKGERAVRAETAPRIFAWTNARSSYLKLSTDLHSEIEQGFTVGSDDAFDAAIGLFGMIDAVQNWSEAFEPKDLTIQNIEGWILGQPIH